MQVCTGAGCSRWSQPEWHFTTAGGLTLSPALLDFGEVSVGQSAEQVVVLGNTGASALTVSYAMDPQGSEFVFVANAGGPHGGTVVLLPGQPDSLRVSFGPEGEGHRTATVLFEDGQQVELGSVSLQGEGVSNPTALTRYYYVTDHLGSVRATVDASGAVVHYDDYYPFGAPMPGRGMDDAAPRERFTGHEVEVDIDPDFKATYYAGWRYYDGLIVRWLSIDPLFEKHPDWTPYNYVLGNPLRLVDPDGRQVDVIAWHGADLSQVGSGRQVQPDESWIANLVGDVQQRSQELGITDTDAAAFSSPVLGSSHGKALDFLKDNHAEGEKIVLLAACRT